MHDRWADCLLANLYLLSIGEGIGQDGQVTGITVRFQPYTKDTTQHTIYLSSTVDSPYLRVGLIPFMDMLPCRDLEKPSVAYQHFRGNKKDNSVVQICKTLGGEPETSLNNSNQDDPGLKYLIMYGDAGTNDLDQEEYKLNLSMVLVIRRGAGTTLFKRRRAALCAHGLGPKVTFTVKPRFFLNRTFKTYNDILICKMLFTYIHLYQADNGKLKGLLLRFKCKGN